MIQQAIRHCLGVGTNPLRTPPCGHVPVQPLDPTPQFVLTSLLNLFLPPHFREPLVSGVDLGRQYLSFGEQFIELRFDP